MKQKRKIIIKSPRLRKTRGNLRYILYNSISKELDRLRNLENLYYKKKYLNKTQVKRKKSLRKMQIDLYNARKSSILECSGKDCQFSKKIIEISSFDKDMVFDPDYKEWYCIDCYNEIEKNLNPSNWFNSGIIINKDIGKPCYVLDWCPYGAIVESFIIRKVPNKNTCLIFDHDCPVFYLSLPLTEGSSKNLLLDDCLFDSITMIHYFRRIKVRKKRDFKNIIKKPCHELDSCPYGFLGNEFKSKSTTLNNTCKLFGHDCPAFYYSEFVSEQKYNSLFL